MWAKFVLNLLVILFMGVHFVLSTEVETCSGVPTPSVEIKDCKTPPCDLVIGTDAEIIISFNSTEYFNELHVKLRAKIGPITIPFPLPSDVADVCGNLLNTNCPLYKDELGVFKLLVSISNYPEISLKLAFTIEGERKQKVACFAVQCRVVKE